IPGKEPGTTLGFIEDTLSDLEDSLGQTIHRYPHISFWRKMNSFMFQPPERLSIIEAAHMPEPDYVDMWDAIKRDLGIPEKSYTADGVKASDSVARRISVMRDRKSTRLNSSHVSISYAVFCLKKNNMNRKAVAK